MDRSKNLRKKKKKKKKKPNQHTKLNRKTVKKVLDSLS
jgi:hypothetical protein